MNNWKALALELAAAFEQQFGSDHPTIERVKLAQARDAADNALRGARRDQWTRLCAAELSTPGRWWVEPPPANG